MDENGETPTPEGDRSGESFRAIALEIGAMAGGAYVLVFAATAAAQFVPLVSQYLYLIVAGIFLGLPMWWLERNDWDVRRFGLVIEKFWRRTAWGLAFAAVTAAPFAVGYWVWETYAIGSEYEFEWENYKQWEPELEGRPSNWGEEPGVWVWTEEREVHVGVRAAGETRQPLELRLTADRPFPLASGARAIAEPVDGIVSGDDGPPRAKVWRVEVRQASRRAELAVEPRRPGTASIPTSFEVVVSGDRPSYPFYVGPAARSVEGESYSMRRGFRWLYLWLMTQLLFIALPEEYFYRGYLQTRIGDAIRAYRRRESDDGGRSETRNWWGVSEQNLLASVAFGVGHLLTPVGGRILWNRVAVAFPSVVFGWLRDRTGTITASVVYHTACNMLVLVAEPHFF